MDQLSLLQSELHSSSQSFTRLLGMLEETPATDSCSYWLASLSVVQGKQEFRSSTPEGATATLSHAFPFSSSSSYTHSDSARYSSESTLFGALHRPSRHCASLTVQLDIPRLLGDTVCDLIPRVTTSQAAAAAQEHDEGFVTPSLRSPRRSETANDSEDALSSLLDASQLQRVQEADWYFGWECRGEPVCRDRAELLFDAAARDPRVLDALCAQARARDRQLTQLTALSSTDDCGGQQRLSESRYLHALLALSVGFESALFSFDNAQQRFIAAPCDVSVLGVSGGALRSLAAWFAQLGVHVRSLRRFVDETGASVRASRERRALAWAAASVLQWHTQRVVRAFAGKPRLLALVRALEPARRQLAAVAALLRAPLPRGAQLSEYTLEQSALGSLVCDSASRSLLRWCAAVCAVALGDQLDAWLFDARCGPAETHCFVRQNESIAFNQQHATRFWSQAFVLALDQRSSAAFVRLLRTAFDAGRVQGLLRVVAPPRSAESCRPCVRLAFHPRQLRATIAELHRRRDAQHTVWHHAALLREVRARTARSARELRALDARRTIREQLAAHTARRQRLRAATAAAKAERRTELERFARDARRRRLVLEETERERDREALRDGAYLNPAQKERDARLQKEARAEIEQHFAALDVRLRRREQLAAWRVRRAALAPKRIPLLLGPQPVMVDARELQPASLPRWLQQALNQPGQTLQTVVVSEGPADDVVDPEHDQEPQSLPQNSTEHQSAGQNPDVDLNVNNSLHNTVQLHPNDLDRHQPSPANNTDRLNVCAPVNSTTTSDGSQTVVPAEPVGVRNTVGTEPIIALVDAQTGDQQSLPHSSAAANEKEDEKLRSAYVGRFWTLEKRISAPFTLDRADLCNFDDTPPSDAAPFPRRDTEALEQLANTTQALMMGERDDSEDEADAPFALERCVASSLRGTITTQASLVGGVALEAFVRTLHVRRAVFTPLARVFLLADARFSSVLRDALCARIYTTSAICAADSTAFAQLLTPACLNPVLALAFDDARFERLNHGSSECRSPSSLVVGPLSFSFALSPAADEPAHAASVLRRLRLACRVEPPFDAIVSNTQLSQYAAVFAQLLALRRDEFVLDQLLFLALRQHATMFNSAPRVARHFRLLCLHRARASAVVRALLEYAERTLITTAWQRFRDRLRRLENEPAPAARREQRARARLDALCHAHDAFVRACTRFCFPQSLHAALADLHDCVHDFYALYAGGSWQNDGNDKTAAPRHSNFGKIAANLERFERTAAQLEAGLFGSRT